LRRGVADHPQTEVEHLDAEVHERSAARTGAAMPPGPAARAHTMVQPAGAQRTDIAQIARRDLAAQRRGIGPESLVHPHHEAILRPGGGQHPLRLARTHRQRLLTEDELARSEPLGDLRFMKMAGCGDHHRIDRVVGPDLFRWSVYTGDTQPLGNGPCLPALDVVEPDELPPRRMREDGKVRDLGDRAGPQHRATHDRWRGGHGDPPALGDWKGFPGGLGKVQTPPTTKLPYWMSLVTTNRASRFSCTALPIGTKPPTSRLNPGASVSRRSSTKVP